MRFRPCIDLHDGKVKQIVGGSLSDDDDNTLKTNFTTDRSAASFAERYRQDGLTGGHIIQLGPGNKVAAESALAAWPQGMQVGGGVNVDNAQDWLDAGAAAVIITSWVFHDGRIDMNRLKRLVDRIGSNRLVLDLSCRKRDDDYVVVTDRWQTFTQEMVNIELLDRLAGFCFEFLIHAVDVEGRCRGIERPLVEKLGRWQGLPVTYAGGIHTMEDIRTIETLGRGRIDFTVGSALDIFGGSGLAYDDLARRFS
ncbi:MAG: phosphoribosylformimino-5-aminoimidazole carboxamide ribotide isomerase [Desulfobacterales bacterium]|nr:phosphoribosylformimino-5-aminoimidazole carboxamide ribotide isomerase [Desulfobacterales bacterium]